MTKEQVHELVLQEKREYARNWRLKNKDRVKEINRRYWNKKAIQRQAGGDTK
jgi:hypothetical protein